MPETFLMNCIKCLHTAWSLFVEQSDDWKLFCCLVSQELSDMYRADNQHQAPVLPELPTIWIWFHGGRELQSLAHWDQWSSSLCTVSNIQLIVLVKNVYFWASFLVSLVSFPSRNLTVLYSVSCSHLFLQSAFRPSCLTFVYIMVKRSFESIALII